MIVENGNLLNIQKIKIAHNFSSGQYFLMKLSGCVHDVQLMRSIEFRKGENEPFLLDMQKYAKITKPSK